MGKMIINDMDKNWGRLILAYGLSEDQIKDVEKVIPTKECEVFKADCSTDIIAIPKMASIVVWAVLTEEDRERLIEYFNEVMPSPETVILIGDVEIPYDLRNHVSIYPTFEDFSPKMKYIFLNALRRFKKNENFSVQLSYVLQILCAIREKPCITTRELAEMTEKSERTVQRYITTLVMAGEWIEYDKHRKGWKLMENKSILLGDIFRDDE